MIGPEKFGFKEGRSGFLVSPSPERFEPNSGVNGNPVKNVAIPFNCQPEASLPLSPLVALNRVLSRPNGNSYRAEIPAWLVTFNADSPQSRRTSFRSKTI